jgi:adenylate cyclase
MTDVRVEDRPHALLVQRVAWTAWLGTAGATIVATLPLLATGTLHLSRATRVYPDVSPIAALYAGAAVLLLLVFVASRFTSRHMMGKVLRWVREDRAPTTQERNELTRLPIRSALWLLPWWTPAFALWWWINLVLIEFSTIYAIANAIGIVLAACVASGLAYLVMESALRPLYAIALGPAGATPRAGVRTRLLLYWASGSASYLCGIAAILIVFPSAIHRSAGVICCALGIFVGFLMTALAARSITDPLAQVRVGMERIGRGDLDTAIAIDDPGDVGRLQAGFNRMVEGLRERDRLSDLFGRNVGTEVAQRALAGDAALAGSVQDATILFVDVVGSTALAVERAPTSVVAALNALFEVVVRCVGAESGLVNQFQGDGALCIFGAPTPFDDHQQRALRAAASLRDGLDALAAEFPGFDAAIGVSSGQVVAGDIGSADRHEYTVIGDPVNEASRLCDEAKSTSGRVLASAATVLGAGSTKGWSPVGDLQLRGRHQPTAAYRPA